MRFLIIQENGRHAQNRRYRECFSMQRSLLKKGCDCDIWGLGHSNFNQKIDFRSYDAIIDLENYDSGWCPDLSLVKSYKIIWSIDAHCQGMGYYINRFKNNKYNLILQATRDFIDDNSIWFPNCFDDGLIKPMDVAKRADVGFCGNICNRQLYLDLLSKNFNFVSDIFVIGDDMVKAINSYRTHFNKNIANDINYRNFETIGCKIPLITNYDDAYEDMGFVDAENCMFYGNESELIVKIKMLLEDPYLLSEVAEKGYSLSSKHTYDVRAETLLTYLDGKI